MRQRESSLENSGFTLVEILVVIMIIAIVAIISLISINPTRQKQKLYDVKRKRDIHTLQSVYELFHNVNSRYPTAAEVCYDEPAQEDGLCSCHICGLEKNLGTLGQLVQALYCDPEHPKASYVYQYNCSDEPTWYKLYTHLALDDKTKKPTTAVSCRYGVTNQREAFLEPYSNRCGILQSNGGSNQGGGGGNGGSSPTTVPTPTPPACANDPVPKYCRLGGICNICGNYADCLNPSSCDQPTLLYQNSLCSDRCDNYGNFGPTPTSVPTPTPFQFGSCPIDPDPKYCYIGGNCNNCGNYSDCINQCDSPLTLYGNSTCNGLCYSE